MAVFFNESSVDAQFLDEGVTVKPLITPERVGSDNVLTHQFYLEPGAEIILDIGEDDIAWTHILEGSAIVLSEDIHSPITVDNFLFLPPGKTARIQSVKGAVVFRALIPDAARFEPNWDEMIRNIRCVDWTNEPVLNSEFDARKRIYMITPQLSGTKAVKGEMIIYPPGTEASNHHHEGAEHFMVVLSGSATFFLNETANEISAGDTIYIYENDRHFIVNDGNDELKFIEYFVPGTYKTVWAENAPICTWNPSGKNIKGGTPSRHIEAHSSAEAHTRKDL